MQGGASIECEATNYNDTRPGTMSYCEWIYIETENSGGMAPRLSVSFYYFHHSAGRGASRPLSEFAS